MCQTYKDMIQDLRDKADFLNKTDYDRNATNSFAVAMRQAANAIERLCIENDCLSEDVTDLVRELNKQKWMEMPVIELECNKYIAEQPNADDGTRIPADPAEEGET